MNSEPAGGTLTFAQLSDPHLTTLEGVRWRDLANKRLLGYLSWLKKRRAGHSRKVLKALLGDLAGQRPDHVVITGDLTHVGTQDEFRQARRWLETVGSPRDVTVIPGNHDAYAPAAWPENLLCWQPYLLSDEPAGVDTAGQADIFPSLRIRGPVAFIGLSSALPTLPFLATGRVGAAQRERFARALSQSRDAGLFRVVLIHHSPVPGDEKWRKRLTDAGEVSAVIEREGAELILHGHGHRVLDSSISSGGREIQVFGIPSASATSQDPRRTARYYVYKVSRDGRHWRLQVNVRGVSGDGKGFEAQGQREYLIP